jgi:polyhydroxyalkanoate synthesis regulator phasin
MSGKLLNITSSMSLINIVMLLLSLLSLFLITINNDIELVDKSGLVVENWISRYLFISLLSLLLSGGLSICRLLEFSFLYRHKRLFFVLELVLSIVSCFTIGNVGLIGLKYIYLNMSLEIESISLGVLGLTMYKVYSMEEKKSLLYTEWDRLSEMLVRKMKLDLGKKIEKPVLDVEYENSLLELKRLKDIKIALQNKYYELKLEYNIKFEQEKLLENKLSILQTLENGLKSAIDFSVTHPYIIGGCATLLLSSFSYLVYSKGLSSVLNTLTLGMFDSKPKINALELQKHLKLKRENSIIETLNSKTDNLSNTVSNLSNTVSNLSNTVSNLNTEVLIHSEILPELTFISHTVVHNDIPSLKSGIGVLSDKVSKLDTVARNDIPSLISDIDVLSDKVSTLDTVVHNDIPSLKLDIDVLSDKVSKLDTVARNDIPSLKSDIDVLSAKVSTLELLLS